MRATLFSVQQNYLRKILQNQLVLTTQVCYSYPREMIKNCILRLEHVTIQLHDMVSMLW